MLEPLGPEHNVRDHAAWMEGIETIRATPGFRPEERGAEGWPQPMTLADNLADLTEHRREFTAGEAFAYSIVRPPDRVIGCVYLDPDDQADVQVRWWVVGPGLDLAESIDAALRRWLETGWPFTRVRFPGR
jgi:hypothetical protein